MIIDIILVAIGMIISFAWGYDTGFYDGQRKLRS